MDRKNPVGNQILWRLPIVLLAGIVLGVALWTWQVELTQKGGWDKRPLEGLKTFGAVPDFLLIERSGQQVRLTDLKGTIWIANFIYTNCPDTCPIQSAEMKKIQDEFVEEKDLRLVSITVDPDRDTPQVLSEYANRFGADPVRWFFLTGEKEAIHRFAQEGFHLGAAEIPHQERPTSGATHMHSPRFVLIDRKSGIRGYYAAIEDGAMSRLRRDLKTLLREKSAKF